MSWRRSDEGGFLAYIVTAEVEASDGDEGGRIFAAKVQFLAPFEIPQDLDIEEAHAEAFGQVTVLPTVFPYIREVIQALSARAGLPPLTLGLLRVPLSAVQDKSAE